VSRLHPRRWGSAIAKKLRQILELVTVPLPLGATVVLAAVSVGVLVMLHFRLTSRATLRLRVKRPWL
jgi:hypothetical protein